MRKYNHMIGFFVTLSLIVISINYLGYLLRPTNTDIAVDAIEAFHDMPENSVEVICYGSSHMWRGVDSMEMYRSYGIGAYNYGCNWQHINTTALFFEDSLRTQTPKVVVIETFNVNKLLRDTNINGELYYTRAIKGCPGKKEYLELCFGDDKEKYLSYYMPLSAFHDNWVNLSPESFKRSSSKEMFFRTKGYMGFETVTPIELGNVETGEQKELYWRAIKILDEIIEACREKNIEVVFLTVPWQGYYEYADAMTAYAEKKGCAYYNLFEMIDEVGLSGETDFSDEGHLNNSGAKKVANFLGKKLVENYSLTDMRTIRENLWEI